MCDVLAEEGLKGQRMRKKFFLTKKYIRKCIAWANERKDWTDENWPAVIYSDESKFNLFGSDGVQYCRRKPGGEFEEWNVQQVMKHGGGSVMVWGCITSHGFGQLVLVEGGMNAEKFCLVLEEGLLSTLEDQNLHPSDYYFQQDTNPRHTSKHAKKWFEEHGIDFLPWPPNSPDQNIIEHAWYELEKAVNHHTPHPTNTTQLFTVLQWTWEHLLQELLDSLYGSAHHRLLALRAQKGHHTRY